MFNVVLYQPEIPPNTGNIIRLCANTGCQLHLIKPLAFDLDDKKMRRAGLDYKEFTTVKTYESWQCFVDQYPQGRFATLSTHHQLNYADFQFQQDDFIIFGPETRGLPLEVRQCAAQTAQLTIPMKSQSRSLNLSNSVSVVVYEAWRQLGFSR